MDFGAVIMAKHLFFDEEDEKEEDVLAMKLCEKHFRNYRSTNYNYEAVVLNYSDNEFKNYFRMSKRSYEKLYNLLKEDNETSVKGRAHISFNTQLLMTLWMLGNKEVYRKLSDRFNVAKTTARDIFYRVLDRIIDKRNFFIKWPSADRAIEISAAFEEKSGFPGIIGCIDGTHVEISAPSLNKESYVNRKGYYSMIIQVVCDDRKMFIDVSCGWPGSMHDARVYKKSDLGQKIADNELWFPPNCHLIGDSAYPLSEFLLVPFRDNGHLNARQKNFNYKLSKNRVKIEHAIGMLKGRFRCLLFLQVYDTRLIPKILLACCCLHNFTSAENDILEMAVAFPECRLNLPQGEQEIEGGTEKRNYIASVLI